MMRFRITMYKTCAAMVLSVPATALMCQLPPLLESTRPTLAGEIPLYPGTAPGSKPDAEPEQWDTMDGFKAARNVTVPTLIPFLPDPAKATGAAVVVAPGGAYMMLTMDTEGIMVARKLAEHGVAAFVLKYRLDLTPRDIAGFNRALGARMDPILKGEKVAEVEQPLAVDDAAAALRLIRSRAAEWHIDPQRTGMVGFSAGARTALRLTLQNRSGARPSFVGVIYGPMLSVAVPDQAPPMFVALAADDPIWGHAGFGLVTSWQAAGRSVELHFYEHGNHGFGMRQTGTTSELWLDEFLLWMKDGKLLER